MRFPVFHACIKGLMHADEGSSNQLKVLLSLNHLLGNF